MDLGGERKGGVGVQRPGRGEVRELVMKGEPLVRGEADVISLRIEESYLPDARLFWRSLGKLREQGTVSLRVAITVWRERRSLNQNAIFHSILRQIARRTRVDLELVKQGVKLSAMDEYEYPEVETATSRGVKRGPLPSHLADTKQMSILIRCAFVEAAYNRVPVREQRITYEEWMDKKNGLEDPLENYYRSEDHYREMHPECEACGEWVGAAPDQDGQWLGQLAHIISKGAGGTDDFANRTRLCTRCHLMVMHQHGWERLIEEYPVITRKVRKATQAYLLTARKAG